MKTRAEDLEDAVREALQMLARGRPADATETLSAALDAPTDDRAVRRTVQREQMKRDFETLANEKHHSSVFRASERIRLYLEDVEGRLSSARDAALEEAALWFEDSDPGTEWDAKTAAAEMCALQSAPAQVVSVAKVREAILRHYGGDALADRRDLLDSVARDLGVDLDAAPAKDAEAERRTLCECGCMRRVHSLQGGGCADCGYLQCPGFRLVSEGSR